MTELDLPQITLARYLELLKRRWWQVIPVTVLGLIAGTVAAFLIPRYYVAETTFVFQGGGALDPDAEDPLYARVTNAPREINKHVEAAIQELGWIEGKDEDESRRTAFIESTADRVFLFIPMADTVRAVNKLNLSLMYSDIDGPRAADLANKLRDVWMEHLREEVEGIAAQELENANRRMRAAEDAKRNAETELRNHMQQHGLSPADYDPKDLASRRNPHAEERRILASTIRNSRAAIARLARQIEVLEIELASGNIKPKIDTLVEAAVDPVLEEEYQSRVEELRIARRRLDNTLESNPLRAVHEMAVESLSNSVAELEKKRAAARTIQVDNPAYLAKREQLTTWRSEIEGLEEALELDQAALERLDEKIAKMPEIEGQRMQFRSAVERCETQFERVREEQAEIQARFTRLKTGMPFRAIVRARVPPRPTDPNIVLVALAGSLIGLGVAIGLILLLDFLQSAFKSVEDVERALPVPVLGALAHLETYEERTRGVAHRRRVSLAAGVFLFLSLSVVTIYFFDPTRLPPGVSSALDLILGAPTPTSIETPK